MGLALLAWPDRDGVRAVALSLPDINVDMCALYTILLVTVCAYVRARATRSCVCALPEIASIRLGNVNLSNRLNVSISHSV